NFGNIPLGTQSSAQTVSVTAPNNDPVTVGALGASFAVSTGTCAIQTPCVLSVTFLPTSVGQQTGNVAVTDSVTGQFSALTLSGTGGVPVLSVSPPSLSFAARNQGTTSIPQTITLTNTGDGSLTI